jgi:cystathionine beta-lyase/cystathionine gamma-synthase
MTQAARDASGITDTLIRVAVGLESQSDLQEDLNRGLSSI